MAKDGLSWWELSVESSTGTMLTSSWWGRGIGDSESLTFEKKMRGDVDT
jgi:hypothetical protein